MACRFLLLLFLVQRRGELRGCLHVTALFSPEAFNETVDLRSRKTGAGMPERFN